MKILILSDIHANWVALEAVLSREKNYDVLFFLGDVVDYGPEPIPCVDFIEQNANYAVTGNHDYALAYDKECGSMGTFREYAIETRRWHKSLLDKKSVKFLSILPKELYVKEDKYLFYLTHASPNGNISRYLYPEDFSEELLSEIKAEFVLVGHSHLQFQKKIGSKIVVNPGSVGLSREDNMANYATFENGRFTLKKVPYDVEKSIAVLMQAPLSGKVKKGLANTLRHES